MFWKVADAIALDPMAFAICSTFPDTQVHASPDSQAVDESKSRQDICRQQSRIGDGPCLPEHVRRRHAAPRETGRDLAVAGCAQSDIAANTHLDRSGNDWGRPANSQETRD